MLLNYLNKKRGALLVEKKKGRRRRRYSYIALAAKDHVINPRELKETFN